MKDCHEDVSNPKQPDGGSKPRKRETRQLGNLPDKLALQRQPRALEATRVEVWRDRDAIAKEIEIHEDGPLDQVEERFGLAGSDERLFAIRFEID